MVRCRNLGFREVGHRVFPILRVLQDYRLRLCPMQKVKGTVWIGKRPNLKVMVLIGKKLSRSRIVSIGKKDLKDLVEHEDLVDQEDLEALGVRHPIVQDLVFQPLDEIQILHRGDTQRTQMDLR